MSCCHPKLPALAAAVAAGDIGPEHVRLIRHTMRRIPSTVDQPTRDAAEEELVGHARELDPDGLKHACAKLLQCVDPDGSLGSADEERQRSRAFSIGRQDRHGMYPVTGLLDPETGALLRAALEPLAAPRHTAHERDMRTVSQRMHDAVRDAAKLMLGSGKLPSQAGVPATLLITMKLDDLERRTGHVSTAHGGLLPIRDVLRMAANAKLVPAVFDTDGAPLWLGREPTGSPPRTSGTCSPSWTRAASTPAATSPPAGVRSCTCTTGSTAVPPTSTTSPSAATTTTTASANGRWNAETGGCGAPHRCGPTQPNDRESIPCFTTLTYSRHLIDDYSATAFWVSSESICSGV